MKRLTSSASSMRDGGGEFSRVRYMGIGRSEGFAGRGTWEVSLFRVVAAFFSYRGFSCFLLGINAHIVLLPLRIKRWGLYHIA